METNLDGKNSKTLAERSENTKELISVDSVCEVLIGWLVGTLLVQAISTLPPQYLAV